LKRVPYEITRMENSRCQETSLGIGRTGEVTKSKVKWMGRRTERDPRMEMHNQTFFHWRRTTRRGAVREGILRLLIEFTCLGSRIWVLPCVCPSGSVSTHLKFVEKPCHAPTDVDFWGANFLFQLKTVWNFFVNVREQREVGEENTL
jgi:hypothetical protein